MSVLCHKLLQPLVSLWCREELELLDNEDIREMLVRRVHEDITAALVVLVYPALLELRAHLDHLVQLDCLGDLVLLALQDQRVQWDCLDQL